MRYLDIIAELERQAPKVPPHNREESQPAGSGQATTMRTYLCSVCQNEAYCFHRPATCYGCRLRLSHVH